MILDKQTAVSLYGSNNCKKYFEKHKKINPQYESSIIKTMESIYETVEKVRQGRSMVYNVGDYRKHQLEKEDGRQTNGANNKLKYTDNLDVIVVSALEQDLMPDTAQTMRKWLLEFGLINKNLFDLMGMRPDNDKKQRHLNYLIEEDVLSSKKDASILQDFKNYTKDLQGQLQRSLSRMKKAGIIDYYEVKKAKIVIDKKNENELSSKSDPEYSIINLHEKTWKSIMDKRYELMAKYDVSVFEIETLTNKKNVKSFNRDYREFLSNGVYQYNDDSMENPDLVHVEACWSAWAINKRGTKNKTMKYLQKFNKSAIEDCLDDGYKFINDNKVSFIKERLNYVVNKAKLAQERSLIKDKKKREAFSKELNALGEEFGINFDKIIIEGYNDDVKMIEEEDMVQYNDILLDELYIKRIEQLQKLYGNIFKPAEPKLRLK